MQRRGFVIGAVAAGIAIGLVPRAAFAAKPEVYANSSSGIAVNGADVVAYFTQSNLVYGVEDFSADWKGAKWLFASAENRDLFLGDPVKYAPQYGGYCAFALAHNAIATTVPEAWTVYEGKLYLNYSLGVRSQWQTDKDGFIAKADGYWPGVLG